MSEENMININEEQEEKNDSLNEKEQEYEKEIESFLKEIEEVRKEENMDEKDRSEYLANIQRRAKQFSPERINKIIDEALASSQFSNYAEREQARKELYDKVAFNEALIEDLEDAQKEYNEEVKKEMEKIDEEFNKMNYSDFLNAISEKINVNKDTMTHNQLMDYQKMYNEVHNIIYFDRIKEKLNRLKNPGKYIKDCEDENLFTIYFNKFLINLQKSKNMFKNPIHCVEAINSFLPKDKQYGKYFIYCLARYINERGVKGVDSNAVFLEGFFNIIFNFEKTTKLNEEHKKEFINNILECVDICLKGKTNN